MRSCLSPHKHFFEAIILFSFLFIHCVHSLLCPIIYIDPKGNKKKHFTLCRHANINISSYSFQKGACTYIRTKRDIDDTSWILINSPIGVIVCTLSLLISVDKSVTFIYFTFDWQRLFNCSRLFLARFDNNFVSFSYRTANGKNESSTENNFPNFRTIITWLYSND